jgi:hypothetical protein
LSYAANMIVLMILYDFCFLPTQCYYVIVSVQKVESRLKIAERCAIYKISDGAQNLVLQPLQFEEVGVCC